MKVRFCALLLIVLGETSFLGADPAPLPLTVLVSPYVFTPLDLVSDTASPGTTYSTYSLGLGTRVSADLSPLLLPNLVVGAVGDYLFLRTADPTVALQLLGGGAQSLFKLKLNPVLTVTPGLAAGVYTAKYQDESFKGLGPWWNFDLGVSWVLSEYLELTLGLGWSSYLQKGNASLATGSQYGLTINWQPAGSSPYILDASIPDGYTPLFREKKGVQPLGLKADQIFPVFKNYYDDHPVASLVLHNYTNSPATGLQVTAEVKDYMNGPRDVKVPAQIPPGGSVTLDVLALFNDRLLSVAESTKLGLVLTVKYRQDGVDKVATYDSGLQVLYRNAMTWEDDRRIAAFISSRDPAASGFIRNVLVAGRSARNKALNQEIQTAMLLQSALRSIGVSYVKDPSSALTSNRKQVIDSLQFPQETLATKTGDCDDLTILWCSLLESVGIETAILTYPGHVLMAFALDTTPEVAASTLGSKDKFLVRNGRVWVPVETTVLNEDFLKAWGEGARQLNPALQPDLQFYPVRDAWKTYAPVVVNGNTLPPPAPSATVLAEGLRSSLGVLLASELTPRAERLLVDIKSAANPAKSMNSLGLLYARYGQYDQAVGVLADLVTKFQYGPGFVNLGNVYLLQSKPLEAAASFGKWLSFNPDDALAVAGQALALDALGQHSNAIAAYERLTVLDAKLAARYQYLKTSAPGDSSRASENSTLEALLSWKD